MEMSGQPNHAAPGRTASATMTAASNTRRSVPARWAPAATTRLRASSHSVSSPLNPMVPNSGGSARTSINM